MRDPFDLDNPLLFFSPKDAWTIRDACEGTQIFGAIGSGKTSGSGQAIAKAFLRSGFGGLVMVAKPEERRLWEQYASETGRSNDLIIFSPDEPWRFNFLDYELQRQGSGGGITENLVNLFTVVSKIAEGKPQRDGGDQFWERAMRELLRNAIDLISIAKGTIALEDISRLIVEAPQSREQVSDKTWQNSSLCAEYIREAEAKHKTPLEKHDFEMAKRYWLSNFATLSDRTRTSIVATFTSIADVLSHGIAHELLCSETNLTPDVTYTEGKIIVLDLPVQEFQEMGRVIQGVVKYAWQRSVLARNVEQYPRPVFLWVDEAQNFLSSFDYQYQAVSRSARACTVYLTQNISNYYSVLGFQGRDEANALLGNFQTKIFHANGDAPTNQYASDIISQEWTTTYNFGASYNDEDKSTHSGGGSQSVQYKVLPSAFTTLRKGSPVNNFSVEAIIFQGGRMWKATGDTFIKTIFRQNSP